jgi:hypothetical protein
MQRRLINLGVFFLGLLIASGCATTAVLTKDIGTPRVGKKASARVGDVFFYRMTYEYYVGSMVGKVILTTPEPLQYELTVVEAAEKSITLRYREYEYSKNPFGKKWKLKPGATTTHFFKVKKKPIWFKGLKFQIFSVEDGVIRYKRIK